MWKFHKRRPGRPASPANPYLRLVENFGVDLDHVVIGIEDIDLRKAGNRPAVDHHLQRIVGGGVFAVTECQQMRQRGSETAYTKREMNVPGIDRLVTPQGGAGMN